MTRSERDILERAVRAVSEQAAKADALVDEAIAARLDGSHRSVEASSEAHSTRGIPGLTSRDQETVREASSA